MAQDGCDRKEAQGNMDAFLENPQGEFTLLSQHLYAFFLVGLQSNFLDNLHTTKFRLGLPKSL